MECATTVCSWNLTVREVTYIRRWTWIKSMFTCNITVVISCNITVSDLMIDSDTGLFRLRLLTVCIMSCCRVLECVTICVTVDKLFSFLRIALLCTKSFIMRALYHFDCVFSCFIILMLHVSHFFFFSVIILLLHTDMFTDICIVCASVTF